jgi:ATP-binding cassette subfamily B protein
VKPDDAANLSPHASLRLYRRLRGEARGYRRYLAVLVAVQLAAIPLMLLQPLPLKIIVDNVIGHQPLPHVLQSILPQSIAGSASKLLAASVAVLLIIALLSLVQRLTEALLATFTGEKLVLNFRSRLFTHVQELSLAYHDTRGATDSAFRIQYDAPAIQWILVESLIPLGVALLTAIGMIAVTARINAGLAVVALLVAPVLAVLTHKYSRPLRDRWHDAMKLESRAMSVVQEVLSSVRVVKAFGRERDEHDRFVEHSSQGIKARLGAAVGQNIFALLVGLTTAAGTAAVLYIGVKKNLTAGDLLIVMSYLAQMYEPMKVIGKNLTDQQKSLVSAQRAFAVLDESPAVHEKPHARPLVRATGHISFQNVCFSYERDRAVLTDISFDAAPGSRVGITGRTGAGKTTLVTLLNRFYDPTAGRILLDGIDLRDYRLADLRKQFAVVLQDPVLFSTTIAQNIAYAKPGATESEIITAAKAADAHDFISSLPQGYSTNVGERGMRLSGGERQRVSLARAFLRNAPILILDEPTSSLDLKTESSILDALDRLMQSRTTFTIAHRLSTLSNCTLRLEIENGTCLTTADERGSISC